MRAALAGRYNTVRPFLALLGESAALHAAPGGERVLGRGPRACPSWLGAGWYRNRSPRSEIDAELVTPAWKRAVYANTGLPAGAVDRDAYVVCVLEAAAPGAGSARRVRPALASLGRPAGAAARRRAVGGGPRGRAGRAQPHRPGADAPGPSADHAGRGVEADRRPPRRGRRRRPGPGRARPEAAPGWSSTTSTRSTNPDSLVGCGRRRRRCCRASTCPNCCWRCTPGPGSWTPTPTSPTSRRAARTSVSVAALLVAEACNIGLTPVINPVSRR